MPRAVIYHDLPLAAPIRDRTDDLDVVVAETVEAAEEALGDANVFVTNPTLWSDSFLPHLTDGDWMQATSIGYAAFPVDAFRERGITLTNAATVHDSVVSEHALALALALSRNLGVLVDQQREHAWTRDVTSEMWDWKGRRMTVYGLGNIGEAVARRGWGFGFDVVGVKRTPSTYTGTLDRDDVYAPADFHDLLPDTDLLVLTVPLTDETYHVIDADVLAALPDSAVLVNVARGSIVDQEALLEALQEEELGGAGLDVFESEPLEAESPLWDRDDVIVTPHVGGRSKDFPERFARLFVDNYERWRTGGPLVNLVT